MQNKYYRYNLYNPISDIVLLNNGVFVGLP